ncbi:universal stress protein [Paraburkholderia graminis]|uniref:universal stress protein n=1 Tax=Paraburkholderia graminis TaxID=60548 RepID=UPI0038B88C8C
MYHKILVALDGSASSRSALYEALKVAQLTRGRIHAIYVVDPWCLSPYSGYFDPEQLRDVLHQDGCIVLEWARQTMANCGVAGETEIEEAESPADDTAHCLTRCVQRQSADLVVMGTHGRRGIRRWLMGSVAETFLRRADLPVLLVRPAHEERMPPDVPAGAPS